MIALLNLLKAALVEWLGDRDQAARHSGLAGETRVATEFLLPLGFEDDEADAATTRAHAAQGFIASATRLRFPTRGRIRRLELEALLAIALADAERAARAARRAESVDNLLRFPEVDR